MCSAVVWPKAWRLVRGRDVLEPLFAECGPWYDLAVGVTVGRGHGEPSAVKTERHEGIPYPVFQHHYHEVCPQWRHFPIFPFRCHGFSRTLRIVASRQTHEREEGITVSACPKRRAATFPSVFPAAAASLVRIISSRSAEDAAAATDEYSDTERW